MDSMASLPVLADFGIISLLIVFAHLLRNRIKFLQNTYIPSAVIAGLIALLCGPQFLDVIPFSIDHNLQNIASYP
jgi:ESS family glutamate:Na+ symporter